MFTGTMILPSRGVVISKTIQIGAIRASLGDEMRNEWDALLADLRREQAATAQRAATPGPALRQRQRRNAARQTNGGESFAKAMADLRFDQRLMRLTMPKAPRCRPLPELLKPEPTFSERREALAKSFASAVSGGRLTAIQTATIQAHLHRLGINSVEIG